MDSNFPSLIFTILFFSIVATSSIHSHSSSTESGCVETERRALKNFKKNMKYGEYWVGNDCCSWQGITCSNITGNVIELRLSCETVLDVNGNVISPLLSCETAFDGKELLPLLSLHHLAHLDLSFVNFTGSQIPKFIGSFHSLQYLDLSYSGFIGRVPDELGNLSALNELRIGGEGLFIENTRCLSQLKSLRYLYMEGMNLTQTPGLLQALNTLPYISELYFYHWHFNCMPPLSQFNFTSLTTITLIGNTIKESLPDWLWSLKNLRYLEVSYNSLYGALPASIGNLTYLETLHLELNNLRGPIPKTIRQLRRLEELYLNSNSFTGNLQDIEFPNKLKTLDLSYNLFYGSLHTITGNLSSLEIISLSNNNLNTEVPESIGQLRSLKLLDMGHNNLRGTLSDAHFNNISMLTDLFFAYNPFLLFNTSDNWVPSFQLYRLFLQFCQVPKFPSWLKTQHYLDSINLSNTGIKGTLPNWFLNFTSMLQLLDLSNNHISGELSQITNSSISDLNLSNNLLSGPIPVGFGENLMNLFSLDLSTNNFQGSIPSSICQCPILNFLRISNNELSGELPNCWSDSSLYLLDLSGNKFHGKIPQTLCNSSSLIVLLLRDNILTSELGPCLTNITSLISLDLGYNKLIGNIPEWIGTKPTLKILSLTSNALTGRIPHLSHLTNLQILDLSNNSLSGHIPPSLGNLTAMSIYHNTTWSQDIFDPLLLTYLDMSNQLEMWLITKGKEFEYSSTILQMVTLLDLSNNALSGHIPDELVQLHGLQTLNLSRNNLTGQIPKNIGELQQLETLDLSRNNLFGTIPRSMGKLHFLGDLDLSYNNLSGRILIDGQMRSFDNLSIYEGNPYLCGFRVEQACPGDDTNQHGFNYKDEVHSDKDEGFFGFYMAIAPGFVVGFWVIWGTLILAENWRIAYFQTIDRFYCMIFERK